MPEWRPVLTAPFDRDLELAVLDWEGNRTHEGGIAVGGERDGGTLSRTFDRAGADQFAALLGPGAAVAGEDPRGPGE